MQALNVKTGEITDVPDIEGLDELREELVAKLTSGKTPTHAEVISFQPVISEYFEAEYGKKGDSVILHVRPKTSIDGDTIADVVGEAFNIEEVPGEWVPEVESWALRVDDVPYNWDSLMMTAVEELHGRLDA